MQEVPTDEDWGVLRNVEAWGAYGNFAGRSVDEILPWLSQRLLGASLDYYYSMPPIPFQYYLQAWERLLLTRKRPRGDDSTYPLSISEVAFYFANIVLDRLKANPEHIMPIMERLLPLIDDIANDPAKYEIDEEFDTSVPTYLPSTFTCWEIRERYEKLRRSV